MTDITDELERLASAGTFNQFVEATHDMGIKLQEMIRELQPSADDDEGVYVAGPKFHSAMGGLIDEWKAKAEKLEEILAKVKEFQPYVSEGRLYSTKAFIEQLEKEALL